MYMKKKKRRIEGRNPKDFCNLWRSLYTGRYDKSFHIKWMVDGNIFKRLMATYSNVILVQLIEFVFRDDSPITKFLKDTGYSISVFEREINKYRQYVEGGCINESELNLDVPYWDDNRISFLSSVINKGDFDSLLQIGYSEESNNLWKIFLQKVKIQDKSFFYKARIYYKRWKRMVSVKRRSIKKCQLK